MKNLRRSKHLPFLIVLLFSLLVGLITVRDYGESWDEADIYRYGDYAIQAYTRFFHPADLLPFNTNLNLYGPGYYMLADLSARLLEWINPAWSPVDAWHVVYFLTFLGCALVVYLLSNRWMSELAALGAVLLFLSQPLFWGHAFINPKDIPFMAFFSAAVYAGMKMVDRIGRSSRLDWTILPAGILLGMTTSFRVIGPLAGLIVLAYALIRSGWKFILPAGLYLLLSMVVAYLTWPYLWGSPLSHYVESITTMSQFPFATDILFWGKLYKIQELPWTYFPTFLGIQLTETALLFSLAGIVLSILLFIKGRREPFLLFLVWFLLPALAFVLSGTPLYDNARQLYFLYPPLFILAGLSFEKVFEYISRPWGKAAVLLIAVLPGLLLSIRLHPYEYTYYNALIGGTGGAFRKFETDYWGTSFKEVAETLNATAPENSKVLVFGPEQIVERYIRPDIQVSIPEEGAAAGYDYAVFLTRENLDERRCKGARPVFSVERRGAVFSFIKSIPQGLSCE